jgi:hypothetical protein
MRIIDGGAAPIRLRRRNFPTLNEAVMNVMQAGVVLAAIVFAGAANAQTRERQQEALDAYLPYAGAPVDSFRFWNLTQWELVAPNKVVVWPKLQEAYLLTVDEPCSELEWAKSIAVTSSVQRVTARFDSVKAGRDECRINEIRPIDYRKYREDRKLGDAAAKS